MGPNLESSCHNNHQHTYLLRRIRSLMTMNNDDDHDDGQGRLQLPLRSTVRVFVCVMCVAVVDDDVVSYRSFFPSVPTWCASNCTAGCSCEAFTVECTSRSFPTVLSTRSSLPSTVPICAICRSSKYWLTRSAFDVYELKQYSLLDSHFHYIPYFSTRSDRLRKAYWRKHVFFAGSMAGLAQVFLACPIEVVKVRLQTLSCECSASTMFLFVIQQTLYDCAVICALQSLDIPGPA